MDNIERDEVERIKDRASQKNDPKSAYGQAVSAICQHAITLAKKIQDVHGQTEHTNRLIEFLHELEGSDFDHHVAKMPPRRTMEEDRIEGPIDDDGTYDDDTDEDRRKADLEFGRPGATDEEHIRERKDQNEGEMREEHTPVFPRSGPGVLVRKPDTEVHGK